MSIEAAQDLLEGMDYTETGNDHALGHPAIVDDQIAMIGASVTCWAVMVSLIYQPTTLRENRSITAATYAAQDSERLRQFAS